MGPPVKFKGLKIGSKLDGLFSGSTLGKALLLKNPFKFQALSLFVKQGSLSGFVNFSGTNSGNNNLYPFAKSPMESIVGKLANKYAPKSSTEKNGGSFFPLSLGVNTSAKGGDDVTSTANAGGNFFVVTPTDELSFTPNLLGIKDFKIDFNGNIKSIKIHALDQKKMKYFENAILNFQFGAMLSINGQQYPLIFFKDGVGKMFAQIIFQRNRFNLMGGTYLSKIVFRLDEGVLKYLWLETRVSFQSKGFNSILFKIIYEIGGRPEQIEIHDIIDGNYYYDDILAAVVAAEGFGAIKPVKFKKMLERTIGRKVSEIVLLKALEIIMIDGKPELDSKSGIHLGIKFSIGGD